MKDRRDDEPAQLLNINHQPNNFLAMRSNIALDFSEEPNSEKIRNLNWITKRRDADILLPITFFDKNFILCSSWWLHNFPGI